MHGILGNKIGYKSMQNRISVKKIQCGLVLFQLCLISLQIDSDHFFPRQMMMLYICMYMCVCMYVCLYVNLQIGLPVLLGLCSDSFRALVGTIMHCFPVQY